MHTIHRGGEWLVRETDPTTVLTPERLDDDHRLIRRTADAFIEQDVLPALERLERKDWALARSLVRRCADLGLLGADVPESLGGVELDTTAALVISEAVGWCASFSSIFGAQTGLAMTPILCFGTADQKRRYIPRLVSADLIGAYALSESNAGSDPLSARTKAVRQADGSFRLTGEKMWITNGGFADLFIVFAKVTEAHAAGEGAFTAFIVERAFAGVGTGQEEHKMGLHGSSTTPLVLEEAHVPAENVLGTIGQGHRVAFNVLNHGRWKLAAMCSGGARHVIAEAAAYAAGRQQFGKAIATFGAIRHKLAEMTIREYAVESMLYRTVGRLDALRQALGSGAAAAALEELAVEASILKVAGSEMLDFVADENVQIHGGNGFVRDYPAERHYRDARVNRIFEGTNEINRLLIPGMLAKRALKGGLPIAGAPAAGRALDAGYADAGDAVLSETRRAVSGIKRVGRLVLTAAMERFGAELPDQQEILTRAADILIDAYAAESTWLRARAAGTPLHEAAAAVFVSDASRRVAGWAADALAAMFADDALRTRLDAVRGNLDIAPLDTIARRRQLADAVFERRVYPF